MNPTRSLVWIACVALLLPAVAVADDSRIAAAVSPAPPDQRDAATVLERAEDGTVNVLRRGDGDLVCLADDPSDERFHVACYHESLEPFMARGRALRAEGMERKEVQAIREKEIEAGTLEFPEGATALYSLTAPAEAYDPETGELEGATRVYVVYTPYATAETTGLVTEPMVPGAPWIMSEGKPWAHVMVVMPPPAAESSDDG